MNKNNHKKNTISLKAPAKINLFLEILGKRDDGYHEIETIMQEIDLADNLQFEEIQEGVKLECNDKNIYLWTRITLCVKPQISSSKSVALKREYQ